MNSHSLHLLNLTDTELQTLKAAIQWYSNQRQDFASAISQVSYRKRNGDIPSIQEVHKANQVAIETSELAKRIINL